MELHQKLLPVPVARKPLQCEKSVVVRYEYLDSENIFRVNSGRLGQVLKASPPCLPPRSYNAWDLCDTQSISESEELTLVTAVAAVEVKKNGPIYRLFNSLVHPKQEDSSNIKAPPIPAQSPSPRNQGGQTSWLPNPSDKVVADPCDPSGFPAKTQLRLKSRRLHRVSPLLLILLPYLHPFR